MGRSGCENLTDTFTGSVAVGLPDRAPVIQLGSGSPATLMNASYSPPGTEP